MLHMILIPSKVLNYSRKAAQLRFVVTFDLARATLIAERKHAQHAERQPDPEIPLSGTFNEAVNIVHLRRCAG